MRGIWRGLSCVGRGAETTNANTAEAIDKRPSFSDWVRGDFDTGPDERR